MISYRFVPISSQKGCFFETPGRFPRRQSDLRFRRIDFTPFSVLSQIEINRECKASWLATQNA